MDDSGSLAELLQSHQETVFPFPVKPYVPMVAQNLKLLPDLCAHIVVFWICCLERFFLGIKGVEGELMHFEAANDSEGQRRPAPRRRRDILEVAESLES